MEPQEIIVEVPAEETKQTEETKQLTEKDARDSGLSEQEIEMAKASGTIVEPKKAEDKKPEKKDEPAKEEEQVTPDELRDDALDKAEQNPEAAYKILKESKQFTRNEIAMYLKQKQERTRRQEAEKERDLYKLKLAVKEKRTPKGDDIDDIDNDLDKDLALLDEDEIDPDKPLTKNDLIKIADKENKKQAAAREQAEKDASAIRGRLSIQEQEAREQYDDFDAVVDLSVKVMNADKHGVFARKLIMLANDPDGDVANYLYQLGKTHPDFGKEVEEDAEERPAGKKEPNIDKVVANAGKKKTSAALGGGSNGVGRRVSEADLTVEDCNRMSPAQWGKLSDATRERILKETCK